MGKAAAAAGELGAQLKDFSLAESEEGACWICLEEGVDESGQPLRRDCSCRGANGFVHLPCIVKYAKTKSTSDPRRYLNEPWETCPSCKQHYQRDLALDMASAQVKFVEEDHPDINDILIVYALHQKVTILVTMMEYGKNQHLRVEGKRAANKYLSTIKAQRALPFRGGELSNDLDGYEGSALGFLGNLCMMEKTDAGYNMALLYYKKLKEHGERTGRGALVQMAEVCSSRAMDGLAGKQFYIQTKSDFEKINENYRHDAKIHGESAVGTLHAGVLLAKALKRSHRGIESERLLMRLFSISALTHGKEHEVTKRLERFLKKFSTRIVSWLIMPEEEIFQALRYVESSERYVIKGPAGVRGNWFESRDESKENTELVHPEYLAYEAGTPVVCYGLKNASHLNGKIGDIRSINMKNGRYQIYFEDTNLKPPMAEVRHQNVRIVFDLKA